MSSHGRFHKGVLSAILLFACSATAATVRGQLVYAKDNSPAAYVAVRLNSPARGPSEFAYSANDGRYYINMVPPGVYTLEIWRGGKTVVTTQVTVQEPVTEVPTLNVP